MGRANSLKHHMQGANMLFDTPLIYFSCVCVCFLIQTGQTMFRRSRSRIWEIRLSGLGLCMLSLMVRSFLLFDASNQDRMLGQNGPTRIEKAARSAKQLRAELWLGWLVMMGV